MGSKGAKSRHLHLVTLSSITFTTWRYRAFLVFPSLTVVKESRAHKRRNYVIYGLLFSFWILAIFLLTRCGLNLIYFSLRYNLVIRSKTKCAVIRSFLLRYTGLAWNSLFILRKHSLIQGLRRFWNDLTVKLPNWIMGTCLLILTATGWKSGNLGWQTIKK